MPKPMTTVNELVKHLCDKLEGLLEEEEENLDQVGEQFKRETWLTWAVLREILTGDDCIKGGESK